MNKERAHLLEAQATSQPLHHWRNVSQRFVFLIIKVWRKGILKNLQIANQTKDILYQMI